MTMFEDKIYEIVIVCNELGTVEEIAFPDVDVSNYFQVGENFLCHVVPESLSKALTFIQQLGRDKFSTNYEIAFNINDQIKTLYLSGFHKNNQHMIIATTRMDAVNNLSDELMKINSEQINQFRHTLKDVLLDQKKQVKDTFNYFDEISKLNNELLNSQRELAQKNQQLNQMNSDLERMATRDPLTGLFNRRLLFDKFLSEKRRAVRLNYPLSMAVIDINHFKRVNDQMGHAAGDELLIKLANLIVKLTRESLDFSFRIGGDEFLILLANCDKQNAEGILHRLNDEFTKFTDIASLACGIIEIDMTCEDDLDHCIMRADALMFENKKGSR